jgi:predicted metal-binding membrane protein
MASSNTRGRSFEGAHFLLLGVLVGLALVAWLVTDAQMQGMDAGPGTDPGDFGFYVGAWVVMMAAMMFPSVAPMVRTYAIVQRRRHQARPETVGPLIGAFIGGYLVTWTAFGVVAYIAFQGIRGLHVDAFAWSRGGPYLAGGVLIAAALYELTPMKDACLTKCRSPLDFLLERWRDGFGGALMLGLEHGAWCVGCCWGLMAALFALGFMSLGWMAFVAALIAIEKLLPWKAVATRGVAVLLLVLGLAVAFVPERVPGLTLPDSPQAGAAMKAMDGSGGGQMPGKMSGNDGMKP